MSPRLPPERSLGRVCATFALACLSRLSATLPTQDAAIKDVSSEGVMAAPAGAIVRITP